MIIFTRLAEASLSGTTVLAQRLEDTASRLLAVERSAVNSFPKTLEDATDNLNIVGHLFLPERYITINMSTSRILGDEMKKSNDLVDRSLATQM